MARALPEWIGATDDQRAPKRVRDRILAAHPNCNICGQPFGDGRRPVLDHVKALVNGGENRESNLRPVHIKCHAEKTAADVAEKAKVAAIRQKHLRIVEPAGKLRSAPFPLSPKSASRREKPALAPRNLYAQEEGR